MGITRKFMSLGSMGLVDFRSDKERTAAYTAAAKKEAKKQTALMRQQAADARRIAQAAERSAATTASTARTPVSPPVTSPTPQLPPADWYPDKEDQALLRWFDGTQWTDFTKPRD